MNVTFAIKFAADRRRFHLIFIIVSTAVDFCCGQQMKVALSTVQGKNAYFKRNFIQSKVEQDDSQFHMPDGDMKEFQVTRYAFNPAQDLRERFMRGEINLREFSYAMMISHLDSNDASPVFIKKNTFCVFAGIDSTGKKLIIIDANNNQDFTDDKVFKMEAASPDYDQELDAHVCISYFDKKNNRISDKIISIILCPYGKFLIHGSPAKQRLNIILQKASSKTAVFYENNQQIKLHIDNTEYGTSGQPEKQRFVVTYDGADPENLYKFGINVPFPVMGRFYKALGEKEDSLFLEKLAATTHLFGALHTPAPNFLLSDLNTRKMYDLNSFAGKYLLIDFWGSWCGPCIAALPTLVDEYQRMDSHKIQLVSIALDDKQDLPVLKALIAKYRLSWPQFWQGRSSERDSSSITYKYSVQNFPTYLLIDPNGEIIYRNIGQLDFAEVKRLMIKNTY